MAHDTLPAGAVAVVGLACRLPGADSPDAFWRLLRDGEEAITRFTVEELEAAGFDRATVEQPGFVAAKGVLAQADSFDAGFFGFSPREAALMDPQQRVFLECAWMALEDAGYDPKAVGGPVGVFAGSILSMYMLNNLWPNRTLVEQAGAFQLAVGNDPTFLATRASYLLDLKGPAVSVGTACSTSLAAVHLACQSLLSHECDMALAGGVSVHLPLVSGYRYEDGGILSPDGHCRPFDAAARGTVSSDGAGVVALKRLEDAVADGDFIHAVIRGSALNNDGSDKVGYTAPGVAGQVRVIAEALAMAGVEPDTLALVEAHAAGTRLGDPIEVAALAEVFAGGAPASCALGSVKSNIGHVDAAAGVAGLIKAVQALRHRAIPPSLHYATPNPQMGLERTPFYVPTAVRPYTRPEPMRAGVSSFGIGGTNAHVVLEEPPPAPSPAHPPRPYELLFLSARSPAALDAAADRLAGHLERTPGVALADVAHTLRLGRRGFELRRVLVAGSTADAAELLRARDPQRTPAGAAPAERATVAFLFPGLGDHYAGMGWELYCTEPVFRSTVDECAELLRRHQDGDIRDFLFAGRDWRAPVLGAVAPAAADGGGKLDLRAMLAARKAPAAATPAPADSPVQGQPGIFVVEYALARLLRSWGIEPDSLIGYSIGEFVAACLAEVVSLPDAIAVVSARARLIESRVARGAMLAVPLPEAELRPQLPPGVSIGAVNGPRLTVLSGEEAGIAAIERRLGDAGVSCQRLRSTHAYHSAMLEAIVAELRAVLSGVALKPPRIPYVSCVTGRWITAEEATSPAYWAQHLCRTVRFQDGLACLLENPGRILLEVGPGQSLTSHALAERARQRDRSNPVIPAMRWSYATQSELAVLLRAVGQLWIAGAPMDPTRLLVRGGERRVPLPTYPFERRRHWIDPPVPGRGAADGGRRRPRVEDWFYLPAWKPAATIPGADAADEGDWLILCDRLGVGDALAARLRGRGARVTTVGAGTAFHCGGGTATVDPACEEDYRSLARALREDGRLPRTVVHLWSLTGTDGAPPDSAAFAQAQETGFHSLMRLFRALWSGGQEGALRVEIVADGLFDVTGHEPLAAEKATLLAPALVAPQERPGVTCRCIDLDHIPADRAALADRLLAEFAAKPGGPAVALRRGRRWVQDYEPVALPPPPSSSSSAPLRRRGVYLLTGGLGGVGLVLARHLARRAQARLVLLGRTPLPDRADWPALLADPSRDESAAARIRQVMELEALGAEVLTVAADVSDRAATARALALAEERFGALNGVIHGAGAVGADTFREITRAGAAECEAQFRAKVHGLLVLDSLLAGRRLDFCVLMSSLAAVLGGLGFAAYSAANLFLDAFARRRNRDGGVPWTSVDWDSWRLGSVRSAVTGLGATVSAFFMEPEEGADALERILAQGNLGQVVVSSGDLHARLRQWVTRDAAPADAPSATIHQRPELRTAFAEPRSQLEQTLAAIWTELFTISPIGIHDNFFELGGHSLLATQLNARISALLHVELSLATLLQAPTIAELATAIVGAQAAEADPETLERMLAELDGLSAEDLERLLSEEPDSQPTEREATAAGHE